MTANMTKNDWAYALHTSKELLAVDGFYYFENKLISGKELRNRLIKMTRFALPSVIEEFVTVLDNKGATAPLFDPWQVYRESLAELAFKPKIIKWFEETKPEVDWEAVVYDITQHKSDYIYLFVGEGETGKSHLIDCLSLDFGEYVFPMNLKELLSNYGTANIKGRLAIIGDDNGDIDYLGGENLGAVKSAVTGNKVVARQIRRKHDSFKSYANFVMCFNGMPTVAIDSGLLRRLIVIKGFKKPLAECIGDTPYNVWRREHITPVGLLQPVKNIGQRLKDMNRKSVEELMRSFVHYEAGNYEAYVKLCKDNGYKPSNNQRWRTQRDVYNKFKSKYGFNTKMDLQKLEEAGL